ncbi:hypothetical protein, partial [Klebsiella pneumoniae]|uniref:hypothetical protein n=1 Tax=Klebsiella pneumoniae TaxID=573 RepID=UPI003EE40DD3
WIRRQRQMCIRDSLISVSGISAYLGYALLDGLANKVLKEQVDGIDKKQQDLEAEQDEFKDCLLYTSDAADESR